MAVENAGVGMPQRADCATMRRQPAHECQYKGESMTRSSRRTGLSLVDCAKGRAAVSSGGEQERIDATLTGVVEELVEEQVVELGVLLVRGRDLAEEDAADDAACTSRARSASGSARQAARGLTAAPHQSDASVVERPLVFGGSLAHEHEALCVHVSSLRCFAWAPRAWRTWA